MVYRFKSLALPRSKGMGKASRAEDGRKKTKKTIILLFVVFCFSHFLKIVKLLGSLDWRFFFSRHCKWPYSNGKVHAQEDEGLHAYTQTISDDGGSVRVCSIFHSIPLGAMFRVAVGNVRLSRLYLVLHSSVKGERENAKSFVTEGR